MTPLYFVYVIAVVVSVFHFGGWLLRESAGTVLAEIFHWLLFVVMDRPDINGMPHTYVFSAGFNWSLRYEWLFYLSLPALFWILQPLRSRALTRGITIAFFIGLAILAIRGTPITGKTLLTLHFGIGALVALFSRDAGIVVVITSRSFRYASWMCLAALLLLQNAASAAPLFLTAVFFTAVAADRTGAGLLHARGVRWLGELSYGIYLLHGLLVYWFGFYLHRMVGLQHLTASTYAAFAVAVGLVATGLATALHFAIELPGIAAGKRLISGFTAPARHQVTSVQAEPRSL